MSGYHELRDYKGLQRAEVAHPAWPAHQPKVLSKANPEKDAVEGDPKKKVLSKVTPRKVGVGLKRNGVE